MIVRITMTGCSAPGIVLCLIMANTPGHEVQPRTAVDLELVLAADTSVSMDLEERLIQVHSYAQVFHDPAVQAAIQSGPRSRIAATYVEWSGQAVQRVIVPWMLIDGSSSA